MEANTISTPDSLDAEERELKKYPETYIITGAYKEIKKKRRDIEAYVKRMEEESGYLIFLSILHILL